MDLINLEENEDEGTKEEIDILKLSKMHNPTK